MRKILAAGLLAVALNGCNAAADPRGAWGRIQVDARPVPMDAEDLAVNRQGNFTYAGGLELHSPDTGRLGGLSDLRILKTGRLYSESDEGDLFQADLHLDPQSRISGLDNARIDPLKGQDGRPLQGKLEADSEGLALWPNGDLMVSFERDHRIWLYPASGVPPHVVPKPDISMPENEGMEGLALSPSHGADAYWVGVEGGSIWLCHLGGSCARQLDQIRPPFGYRLTALSETPEGDLVVLHHRWNPLTKTSSVIAWITRTTGAGATEVRDRLVLAKPLTVDNFEGVETAGLPGGGARLFLISDDNFSNDQRTLLLAYDWIPHQRLRP